MAFQLTALVIIAWLMTVALLDPARGYFLYWAGFVIILWFLVQRQRAIPWTTNNIMRVGMLLLYFMVVLVMAILIGGIQAYLIFLELVVLIAANILLRRQAT